MAPKGIPLRLAVPILIALCVLACVPVWLVKYPPLVDWPLHTARWYLLSLPQDGSGITEFYRARFQPVPNLGMDLLMMQVMKVVPSLLASKLAVCLVIVALVSGGFAFSTALFERVTVSAFLPVLALYDVWFLMGFANYLLGIGIAFWAVAAWLWSAKWSRTKAWVVLGLFGVVLVVTHLMAFSVAVGICASIQLSRRWPKQAATWALVGSLALCVFAYLGLLALGKTPIAWVSRFDASVASFGPAGPGVMFLGAVLLGSFRSGQKEAVPAFIALFVFALFGPSFLGGTAFACDRLSLPALVLLFAVTTFQAQESSQLSHSRATHLVLTAAILGTKPFVFWAAHNKSSEFDGAEVARRIEARCTLVTYSLDRKKLDTWKDHRHVADWLLLEKPIFIAQNFAKRLQQPMVFQPEYEPFHQYQKNNPVEVKTWDELTVESQKARKLQSDLNAIRRAKGVQTSGLYALVLVGSGDAQPIKGADLVTTKPGYALYRIQD